MFVIEGVAASYVLASTADLTQNVVVLMNSLQTWKATNSQPLRHIYPSRPSPRERVRSFEKEREREKERPWKVASSPPRHPSLGKRETMASQQ